MSKLKSLVAEAVKQIKSEIETEANKALEATAKSPNVEAPKARRVPTALKAAGIEAQRLGELGYIVKSIRKGELNDTEKNVLGSRFKAIGETSDISTLLPSGFTGALIHDMQERLVVTALFPYKETTPGQYDSIAIHGITAYLTDEATDGTDSAESYTTMIYLVKKAMAIVRKSYEALDDSLIGLAEEVRAGIIDALARAIENAVVNGDNSTTHMDDATNAGIVTGDYRKAFRGLRYLGLNKNTVDFGGAALDEADWLAKISEMQETGGVYLDDQAVSRGEVVLIVDQNCYNQLRMLPSFLTKDKAAANATLFGAPVDTVFGIPVVMTPFLPIVDATGVVNATAGSNTLSSVIMVNRTTCRYYTTGAVLAESDRNITNQHIEFTGSVRAGFSSIFDQVDSDPTAVDSDRNNIVVGINVDRA